MSDLRDRPVFICGHPKAGTTLIRNLLDSHPQLVVFPRETVFFRRYMRLAHTLEEVKTPEKAEKLWSIVFGEAKTGSNGGQSSGGSFSLDRLRDTFFARDNLGEIRHPGDLLSALVLAYGEVVGYELDSVRWWVEKTPYQEQFTRQTLTWWPNARFIHIVRDPCDNYASYQRKHSNWEAGFFAANWNPSTRTGFKNAERLGPETYLVMPYEDLVHDPEAKLAQICDFLEIEDHPCLRQPTQSGQPWRGNSMFDDRFSAISTAAVGRWQSVLDPFEAALIQLVTRKYRRALGYHQESRKSIAALAASIYWRVRPALYDLVKGEKSDW